MKKILKVLNGFLICIAVLLAGSCAVILLYSKFHTNPNEKGNALIEEQRSDRVLYEDSREAYLPDNPDTENVSGSLTKEQIAADSDGGSTKEALSVEQVYNMLCDKYSLTENNLLYYGEMDINGEPYYCFHVIDSGGGEYDSLLVYNENTHKEFLYDALGNMSNVDNDRFAYINNIYENVAENSEEWNGTWEDTFNEYVDAVFYNIDRDKATELLLPGYFYIYDSNIRSDRTLTLEELMSLQEQVIISMEYINALASREQITYLVNHKITHYEDYTVRTGDLCEYVCFDINIKFYQDGEMIDYGGEYYAIDLVQTPEGWKVIWIGEE